MRVSPWLSGAARWLVSIVGIAVTCALMAKGFAEALIWVAGWHKSHPDSVWALPLAGGGVAWLYQRHGKGAERGHHQLHDALADPAEVRVPLRKAPMIVAATLLNHALGASVGREGTAVLAGGGIGAWVGRWRVWASDDEARRVLILCGIAGGFSALFGAPLAATAFATEVYGGGSRDVKRIGVTAVAALIAHGVATSLAAPHMSLPTLPRALEWAWASGCLGIVFVLFVVGYGYAFLMRRLGVLATRIGPVVAAGLAGTLFAILVTIFPLDAYRGLGVNLIESAFAGDALSPEVPFLKLLLTALCVGLGLRGGDVTPIFAAGATAGAVLGAWFGVPVALASALGLCGLFGVIARSGWTAALLLVDLFGSSSPALTIPAAALLLALGSLGPSPGHYGRFRPAPPPAA